MRNEKITLIHVSIERGMTEVSFFRGSFCVLSSCITLKDSRKTSRLCYYLHKLCVVKDVHIFPNGECSLSYKPKPPEVKIVDLYPAPKEQYNILDAKFFPADNKQQIIAVAVADDTNGWAAYIGVMPDAVMPSVATQIVARDGVKMFASEAAGLFPASAHVQSWVSRTYRK